MEAIYFFELIKRNAILYSILINGNFSLIDFHSENVRVWSDKAIEIKNINLDQDVFGSVLIVLYDSFTSIEFRTSDSKFFNNSKLYFGKDTLVRSKSAYLMSDNIVTEEFKELGIFNSFNGPTSVTLRHFSHFNYAISLRFYGEQTNQKRLSKPTYFIMGIEVPQEVLHLFKSNEIILIPTFTPFEYVPKIEILVKNSNHPVLKYFANKASLSYGNRIYDHGRIPKINPHKVCGLTYLDQRSADDSLKVTSVLIVNLCRSDVLDKEEIHISYEVWSPEVRFFKIEDRIVTLEELELSEINLERDYALIKTLFGKEAVDEFTKLDYAQGISVYKLK